MATHHGTLTEYAPAHESWTEYVERLELYFVANDIVSDEKKRAILLNACGPTAYKLFRNLTAPAKPSEVDYEDLKTLMRDHATPKPSVMVERFRFHSRTQKAGESVADFVAQLKRLSEHCKFSTTTKEMLRDRLVCGLADRNIQRKLLAEADLTLDAALDTARAMEAADQNARALQPSAQPVESQDVNLTQRRRTSGGGGAGDSQQGGDPCSRCGSTKHTPEDCRFKSVVCHACKKRGHIARVCRAKRQDKNNRPPRSRRSNSTNAVDREEDEDLEEEEEEEYALFSIRSNREPIRVEVLVNGKSLSMILDTGAAVSIISEATYRTVWPTEGPSVQPSATALKHILVSPFMLRGA